MKGWYKLEFITPAELKVKVSIKSGVTVNIAKAAEARVIHVDVAHTTEELE